MESASPGETPEDEASNKLAGHSRHQTFVLLQVYKYQKTPISLPTTPLNNSQIHGKQGGYFPGFLALLRTELRSYGT